MGTFASFAVGISTGGILFLLFLFITNRILGNPGLRNLIAELGEIFGEQKSSGRDFEDENQTHQQEHARLLNGKTTTMTDDKYLLPFSELPDDLTRIGGTYASPELSRVLNMARGSHWPEIYMQDVICEKFTAGEGVLAINPEQDDATIASDIRCSLALAKGHPFKVVQAPSSLKD